jgi:alkyl hydroperoxide reductase subunit AhpF
MMRYIGPLDQEKIRNRFEQELVGKVKLVLFAQPPTGLYVPGREESQTGRQAQALMQELTELSDKLTLEVHNPRAEPEVARTYGVERNPALILEGESGRKGLVRFFGLPSGYEFSTLLEDIVDVSKGSTRLSAKAKEAIAELPGPLHLQVFVTPT